MIRGGPLGELGLNSEGATPGEAAGTLLYSSCAEVGLEGRSPAVKGWPHVISREQGHIHKHAGLQVSPPGYVEPLPPPPKDTFRKSVIPCSKGHREKLTCCDSLDLKASLRISTAREGSTYFLLEPTMREKRFLNSCMKSRYLCSCSEQKKQKSKLESGQ